MENNLEVINEQEILGKQFRMYGTVEQPLFLAKDVAEWIEYNLSSINKMLNKVDVEEKTTRKISPSGSNYQTEAWFLTEDGLYEVLMQSRKPIAKQFKKKVKEILKDIRKHGAYMTEETLEKALTSPDFLIRLATELKHEKEARLKAEEKIEIDRPKVQFANSVSGSPTSIPVGDLAKIMKQNGVNIGQKTPL